MGLAERPVAGAVVYLSAGDYLTTNSLGIIPPYVGSAADGSFELHNVPTGRDLHVYAEAPERRLAGTAVFEIPAEPAETPSIALDLALTVRASVILKNSKGDVLANTSLNIRPVVQGQEMGFAERAAASDDQGRLELDGIVPGLEYAVREAISEERRAANANTRFFQQRMQLAPMPK